jgi:hypothetical protein
VTRLSGGGEAPLVVDTERYRLSIAPDGLLATLTSPGGRHWASLRLLSAFDRVDARDETLAVEPPAAAAGDATAVTVRRRSTCWDDAVLMLQCSDEAIELRAEVRGRGSLADVHLLGGRSLLPHGHTGFLPSGSSFRTLFSPNPGHTGRLLRSAWETAVIGVAGNAEPGRGHWFFTPAPLFLALTTAEGFADPGARTDDGWLGLGVAAPVDRLTFVEVAYEPADLAFSLRLDYDGHTDVDGAFQAPVLVLTPGLDDPYDGIQRYRDDLLARGAAPQPPRTRAPAWWREPIFCGWGEQCYLARTTGRRAPDLSTQANYDRFVDDLERHGVVPGTVVIDDKWQDSYGTCRPDEAKWPDLRAWIAARHARGQRVLLWWKAWDAEGLPPGLCLRNSDGTPLALDPCNARARERLQETIAFMLGPGGLHADGLKIDFTGSTPSGRAIEPRGARWGISLLHELLAVVYRAAKAVKPDCLVITHTPHPAFTDVTDMVRLNDMLRLDDPYPIAPVVPQMRYRAAVVRAACPGVLVDTDDWCVPDLAAWREYLEDKPALGVPSLYYATHVDLTGEPLEDGDYDALARTWAAWRSSRV